MKIKMLSSQVGSTDGIRTASYVEGVEYDLSATNGERDLAAAFVGAGMAEVSGEEFAQIDDAPADEPGSLIESEAPVAAATVVKINKPTKSKK